MTGGKSPGVDDRVERLARKLLTSTDEDAAFDDIESARRAAAAQLEASEARTFDPAVTDPGNPDVIRRTSDETAPEEGAGQS